jgi:adenine C2-methylase RlmN of 23S rRNA A2503 and tRNA A37
LIGSTKIAPRVRELTDSREQVELNWILHQIFGAPARELMPVQRAIVEAELVERGFRYRPRSTIWERS